MLFLQQRREKFFGDGCPRPLNRNSKLQIMAYARSLMRPTEKGRAYGAITAKTYAVLQALLWKFHNARSGLCFPSYEKIAEAAGCARSTVAEAIKALEAVGLLTWCHRIGRLAAKVIRKSNGYRFNVPPDQDQAESRREPKERPKRPAWRPRMPEIPVFFSKSEKQTGPINQESILNLQNHFRANGQDQESLKESFKRCWAALPQYKKGK